MEEHLLMCYGDQQSLASALSKRDINAFRRVLHSPSDVEKYDSETHMSIFEQACQTPDCGDFIVECILAGCDVNKLNPEYQKRPINFAVESLSDKNLSALLSDPNVNVDSKYSTLTPLNFLAEQITDADFSNAYRCIKLLVKHFADLNIAGRREMTPILTILKNKHLSAPNKELVVTYLLENGDVDIDTPRKGEARSLLTKLMPDLKLPPIRAPNEIKWDFNRLMMALQNENESEFLQGINFIAENDPDQLPELFRAIENGESLMVLVAKKGIDSAIERMLRLGADINATVDTPHDPLNAIKSACIYGNWKVLDVLLKSPKLDLKNAGPLLSIIVKNIGERITPKCNYEKCFQMLLKHRNIDIDQKDLYDSSALHYAVKFNNTSAILDLLKRGAYIGVKNKFDRLSISSINPKILEKHFDNCISTNDSRPGDDNFEIQFDYTNLVPLPTREFARNSDDCKKVMDSCPDEMVSIEYMAESNDLRHLIRHPLIASFLFLKWNRLAFIFYMNFLLCSLFALSTCAYILVCYNEEPSSKELKHLMRVVALVLTAYIALREISQFTFSPRAYLRSLENYLECALIVLVILILFDLCDNSWRQTVAATSILLIAIEIFLLAGSLPFWSFSTHYVMLKTVTWSFLKSLSLYAIILVAFSLSFFTLLRESPKAPGKQQPNDFRFPEENNNDKDKSDDDGSELNKFNYLGLSIIKTLVMSTGEFDAASINFELNPWSYFVFIAFLFIISTVLLNLLNGLAVSDTQVIKSEAELTNFIRRCQVLARYEKALLDNNNWFSCSTFMRYFARATISVFKDLMPVFQVRVKPNANNQIYVAANDEKKIDAINSDMQSIQCANCFSCFGKCSRMDKKIVKLAFHVLEKVKMEMYEKNEKDVLKVRIGKIEHSLDIITNKLNTLLSK